MESKSSAIEDASFILFILPIVVSGLYAIYAGITSAAFNIETYVAVTSNPFVFIIAIAAVCAAMLLEVYYSPPEMRSKKIDVNARRMQKLAIVTLVLSVLAAGVAIGAAPLPLFIGTFLIGRYPILFSALLVFLSFLVVIPLKFQNLGKSAVTNALAIILLILAPIAYSIGGGGSIPFEPRAAAATLLVILGLILLIRSNSMSPEKKA